MEIEVAMKLGDEWLNYETDGKERREMTKLEIQEEWSSREIGGPVERWVAQ